MVFTKFLGRTDPQTHSQTDTSENIMPPAMKVFGDRGIETNLWISVKLIADLP